MTKKKSIQISRIILLSGLFLFAVIIISIGIAAHLSRQSNIQSLQVADRIVDIQPVKSDIPWYRAKLGDGSWITLNRPMVYEAEVGDSLFKNPGESFFILKKSHTGKRTRWNF